MKPRELILLVSKLSTRERQNLKESRDKSSYMPSGSVASNQKKTMFNTFDSSMQTLASQFWYTNAAPSN